MKNKGFTLVELIAVVALLAIIMAIAAPNIINMLDNSKKQDFVSDAKEMIGKAKYRESLEKYKNLFTSDGGNCRVIKLKDLGYTEYVDADGNYYDMDATKVRVCLESNTDIYYIVTKSKDKDGNYTRGIYDSKNASGYVKEANLDINMVVDF